MAELPAPPDAADPSAVELMRAWLVGETLQCSLFAEVFEEPSTWGAVLADLARHLVSALHENDAVAQAGTLRLIREAFIQELAEQGADQTGSTS